MNATMGQDLEKAIDVLKSNKVVAIPTETVYGLAGNALSTESVAEIFRVKNRPSFDPLIVHVPDVTSWNKYAKNIPEKAMALANKVGPAPITYILPKKDIIPDIVTSGHPTVGLRIHNHPLTLDLLNKINFPLAAPSANPFGYVSPTTAQHVQDQLGEKIQYILDGGPCNVGVESTIIDFSGEKITVLRLGGFKVEELEELLEEKLLIKTSSSNPSAPGMLISHYSPGIPLVVGNIQELLEENKGKKISVISLVRKGENTSMISHHPLSEAADLNEAARNLFKVLRELKETSSELIIAEKFPDQGLGKAINDRLKRAAGTTF